MEGQGLWQGVNRSRAERHERLRGDALEIRKEITQLQADDLVILQVDAQLVEMRQGCECQAPLRNNHVDRIDSHNNLSAAIPGDMKLVDTSADRQRLTMNGIEFTAQGQFDCRADAGGKADIDRGCIWQAREDGLGNMLRQKLLQDSGHCHRRRRL